MSFLKSIVRTAGRGVKGGFKLGTGAVKGSVKLTGHVATGNLKGVVKDVRSAGKSVVTTAAGVSRGIKNSIASVPIVGKPFSAVYNLTIGYPYQIADSIVKGERLDRVAINSIKNQVKDVKAVAPYAQMVITLVPGVGQGISAGLGAGLALAEGQPISAAIKAGVLAAIPGGPIAKSVADISVAVIQKKPLDSVLLAGLPLDAAQKKALTLTLNTAKDLAAGKRVDKVALGAAESQLPPDVLKAAKIGVSIGHGANLQTLAKANLKPVILEKLQADGRKIVSVNPVVRAGFAAVKDPHQQAGFAVGAALTRFQLKPIEAVAVRAKLSPAQKKGFDMALAAHVGAVTTTPPAIAVKSAGEQFAWNATVGAANLSKGNQKALVNALAATPDTRAGVALAAAAHVDTPNVEFEVSIGKQKTFWRRVVEWLGLAKAE
jgi:hypothetical protein